MGRMKKMVRRKAWIIPNTHSYWLPPLVYTSTGTPSSPLADVKPATKDKATGNVPSVPLLGGHMVCEGTNSSKLKAYVTFE